MSTTPQQPIIARSRSTSRTRTRTQLPSRPTTPLRPPSRTSLRASQTGTTPFDGTTSAGGAAAVTAAGSSLLAAGAAALDTLEPAFAEMADGLADLEANMLHLQLMHESVARFTESFGAFLYGLNMNAFCVDFVEAPVPESFRRAEGWAADGAAAGSATGDGDATFLTTDTSFVENPPASSRPSSKFSTPAPNRTTRGRGTAGSRGGGIPRASGIARGVPRGRGRAATGHMR